MKIFNSQSAHVALAAALVAAAIVTPARVARAATTGAIEGRITDEKGKPIGGVTVVVSGPQGEQTEFTDSSGRYIITDLPPGEYNAAFFYGNVKKETKGIRVDSNKTLAVNVQMGQAKAQEIVIDVKAPNVDVANTNVGASVTDELVRNTPVGRTYSAVLALAPGTATDGVGFSFNGATGAENVFLIDGMNTTNPAFGLLGTPLTLEFIKETEIITGGYNAEYGRATGGLVNVVTKSGTNEWHGGVWVFGTPLQLPAFTVGRPGEAIVRQSRLNYLKIDFGFDIGGPIVKNRIFFYAGFHPSFTTEEHTRILRERIDEGYDPNRTELITNGAYSGDPDTSIQCPSWLSDQNPILCEPSKATAFKTKLADSNYWKTFYSQRRLWNAIAKLSFRINDNNRFDVSYIASPSTFDGASGGGLNGNTDALPLNVTSQVHDVVAVYSTKLLDRRLQIDVRGGLHYESNKTTPNPAGLDAAIVDTRTRPLSDFEPELEPCKPRDLPGKTETDPLVKFFPCPTSGYRDGGIGFYSEATNWRASAAAGATYFLKLLGTHALKLGGDFEYNYYNSQRTYTGGANGGVYQIFTDGSALRQSFGTLDDKGNVQLLTEDVGGFRARTSTLNYSVYLRDSWNFDFLPGFTLNLGIRWEAQEVKDINGRTAIGIYDNWAPRIGFAYDFTGKGKSKLYAQYGWFYESIPLNINDRQFSSEGLVFQFSDGPCAAPGSDSVGAFESVNLANCRFGRPSKADINGGVMGKVSPLLRGQYSQEIVLGLEYDVGFDMVLGASFVHRDLGRVVEDISPDGGHTYIIANPGEAVDQKTVDDLQRKIETKEKEVQAASGAQREALTKERQELSDTLSLYRASANFERPRRDYNALQLKAQKRLSHNFIMLASYTYSRTVGNYPGLFQASNGQLDPNISTQYDLSELLINRSGPLPTDRPHNFKLTGAYFVPIKIAGNFTISANFNVVSGTPIEVLGRHPTYGANETFILPRGSGGRMPPLVSLDAGISWQKQFGKLFLAAINLDIFNMLNLQGVTAIDQAYTVDRVLPIRNGTYEDLKNLRASNGAAPRLNPNFGAPTGYQQPLSLRLGARISF